MFLTLAALAVRLYQLAVPALRWDEGWSLAHATLPWSDLLRLAAEDWHPPLYLALLKLWLVTGKSVFSIRLLSVLLGTLAVPLAALVGKEWSRSDRVAVLSAGFAAFAPLLVYYGQVTRMYPLAVLPVLGAAWFVLRDESRPSWRNLLGLAACAALALYALYYTGWALAAIWLYAAIVRPRRIPHLVVAGLLAVVAYVPWLLMAKDTILARVSAGPAGGGNVLAGTIEYLKPTLQGLAFTYGSGWPAGAALALVLLAGAAVALFSRRNRPGRPECARLLLPLLVVGLSVLGIAYGAQSSRWFAARHLVPCSMFLGLILAWCLDRLAARAWPLLPVTLLILAVAFWPTSSRFVYEKMLEVVDAFDPTEDYRYLADRTGQGDLIYFNVLSRAGWYENLCGPEDAPWSYAMRWDPIIEPMERIAERLERDSRTHRRLWFALYKGDYGSNAPLVAWLNGRFYPAGGEWQGDMLYLAFVEPAADWREEPTDAAFPNGIRLASARWTADAQSGGVAAVELTWTCQEPVGADYTVFVHLMDDSGRLVAQHDALPGGDQATTTWSAGQTTVDRHGLMLPDDLQTGDLRVLVGLYDSATGERLPFVDGADARQVGEISVR
ncbi:MAG: glycosyltransferase family 39 protein [Anaerolineae bacterium]